VKLAISYEYHHIPVKVEVEGVSLNPERACELLATCLHELDIWLEKILSKEERSHGDVHSRQNGGPRATDEDELLPSQGKLRRGPTDPPWKPTPPCTPQQGDPRPP
jgi:hypothetical protein